MKNSPKSYWLHFGWPLKSLRKVNYEKSTGPVRFPSSPVGGRGTVCRGGVSRRELLDFDNEGVAMAVDSAELAFTSAATSRVSTP